MAVTPWCQGCAPRRYQDPDWQVTSVQLLKCWFPEKLASGPRPGGNMDQGFVAQTQLLYHPCSHPPLCCCFTVSRGGVTCTTGAPYPLRRWASDCMLPPRSSPLTPGWTSAHDLLLHPNHSLDRLLFCSFWPVNTRILWKQKSGSGNIPHTG